MFFSNVSSDLYRVRFRTVVSNSNKKRSNAKNNTFWKFSTVASVKRKRPDCPNVQLFNIRHSRIMFGCFTFTSSIRLKLCGVLCIAWSNPGHGTRSFRLFKMLRHFIQGRLKRISFSIFKRSFPRCWSGKKGFKSAYVIDVRGVPILIREKYSA